MTSSSIAFGSCFDCDSGADNSLENIEGELSGGGVFIGERKLSNDVISCSALVISGWKLTLGLGPSDGLVMVKPEMEGDGRRCEKADCEERNLE